MMVRILSPSDSARYTRLRERSRRLRSDCERPVKIPTSKPDDSTVLVAEDSGALLGFLYLRPSDRIASRGTLTDLWVQPASRGQGVGEALLRGALQWAEQTGWQRLELWVREDNPAARRLYRRLGFRETGRMKNGDLDSPQQHLHLALRLASPAALPF